MDKAKILYVEDEKFLGQIVKESLENRGFEIRMETDGVAGLEAFRKFSPDLCILDVMLPRKDGFSLAKDIRSLDPAVPILFLTAKTQTEDVVNGFRIGGNDYIRKPFSLEELVARIDNALRRPAESLLPESVFTLGAFTLDPRTQVLAGPEGERKLSFRECALISLLWQSRQQIIDRKHLLQTIWKDDSYFNSRNLDVYITRIRSYLKGDARIEIITLKGQGYRFIVP